VNMPDIQGHTNRELVIVCSHTFTNYITAQKKKEGVVKRNKVSHFDHLSFMIDSDLFSFGNIFRIFFRYKFYHGFET